MKYRAEIDGLRAVAVLPVIMAHAGFELFSGGFVGVDIFFVISGYLITTIIYGEVQAGSFSIIRFYERRVRRIMPALFVVSLACLPFAWAWMLPVEFKDFAQSLIAVNFFASNMLFAKETGYFAAAAELKPMLHTWSLAVEEQFYLFFPIVLMVLHKLKRNALLAVLVVGSLVSLGLAQWQASVHPSVNFFILPTRAWELGVGAILAVSASSWSRIGARGDGRFAQWASTIGMAMILFAIFTFDETVPFPSVWGLIPVLGTAAVIAFATRQTFVGKILSWGPFVGVGLISYSAYLWHQPLFAFARIRLYDSGVSGPMYLGLSVAALVLAYLSWRYVEQPFRNKTLFSRAYVFRGAALVSASFVAAGVFVHMADGVPNRLRREALQYAAWQTDMSPYRDRCNSGEANHFVNPDTACVFGSPEGELVHVWGDSHGVELAWRLSEDLTDYQMPIKQLTHSACVPAAGVRRSRDGDACLAFSQNVFSYLEELDEGATVVIIARWAATLEVEDFDNHEGGVEHTPPGLTVVPLGESDSYLSTEGRIDAVGRLYKETVESLLDHGHLVVLVYHVPEAGWNVPQYLARESHHGVARNAPLSTSHAVFTERAQNAYAQLDKIDDHPNLIRVRPEEIFCDSYVPGRCVTQLDGEPLYFDEDHLNSIGAGMLSETVVAQMDQRGWLPEREPLVQVAANTGVGDAGGLQR